MKRITAKVVYHTVLNLDSAVYKKNPVMPGHTPWVPKGDDDIKLPSAYYKWASTANPVDVDEFWYAVDAANWKRAEKISGLKSSVIAEIMTAAKASGRNRGKASPDDMYVLGIPLSRFLYLAKIESPLEHSRVFLRHFNRRRGPPYSALGKKQREAYEWLAAAINKEVNE